MIINKIFKIFLNNLPLKILSLIFALVLFFIVRTDRNISFERTATVRVVAPTGLVVVGQTEHFFNVTVRSQNTVLAMAPSDVELSGVVMIPANTQPGQFSVKISQDNFPSLPKNYLITIDKPYIEMEVDKIASKIMPVHVVLLGTPAVGYHVQAIHVVPHFVTVTGPDQLLARMTSMYTLPINISDETHTIRDTHTHLDDHLENPELALFSNSSGTILRTDPANVHVNVDIIPNAIMK